MSREPTVFLVDNDAESRDALSALVTTMGLPCETYSSGREFLDAYDPSWPGCAVLEVRLSRMGGLQVQQRLAESGAALPTIFLTTHGSVSVAVRAMIEGAFHFLEKPFNEQVLWDVIHEAIALDEQRREEQARHNEIERRFASLNNQEHRVLEMVLDGNPNKTIATELDLSIRTIEIRRSTIMSKLEAKSFADLIRIGMFGYNDNGSKDRCRSLRTTKPR